MFKIIVRKFWNYRMLIVKMANIFLWVIMMKGYFAIVLQTIHNCPLCLWWSIFLITLIFNWLSMSLVCRTIPYFSSGTVFNLLEYNDSLKNLQGMIGAANSGMKVGVESINIVSLFCLDEHVSRKNIRVS